MSEDSGRMRVLENGEIMVKGEDFIKLISDTTRLLSTLDTSQTQIAISQAQVQQSIFKACQTFDAITNEAKLTTKTLEKIEAHMGALTRQFEVECVKNDGHRGEQGIMATAMEKNGRSTKVIIMVTGLFITALGIIGGIVL